MIVEENMNELYMKIMDYKFERVHWSKKNVHEALLIQINSWVRNSNSTKWKESEMRETDSYLVQLQSLVTISPRRTALFLSISKFHVGRF
jgi:hypothetical protein